MRFHEKLNFLMTLTHTSNSALALQTSLDASHISRLRRGQRKLVKDADYIIKLSCYLARQCTASYQQEALVKALNTEPIDFADYDRLCQHVYEWLIEAPQSETHSVSHFLAVLEASGKRPMPNQIPVEAERQTMKDTSYYYGIEGKREAVIKFLTFVATQSKPQTLYLYSDEAMDWMTQDATFRQKWMALLTTIIQSGHKIKIIHTVSRNLDEMLDALTQWIPLYLTGAIEPYFYPKKRDGIFKRTLFICDEKLAISANSLDDMASMSMNALIADRNAVKALIHEFESYLRLCKPLIHIFTPKAQLDYYQTLKAYETAPGSTISIQHRLTLLTMPEALLNHFFNAIAPEERDMLFDVFKKRRAHFYDQLKHEDYTEILTLDDIELLRQGAISIAPLSNVYHDPLPYTTDMYCEHLKHIRALLSAYPHYHVCITRHKLSMDFCVSYKEEVGVIVEKNSLPKAIFSIVESNLAAAFSDYMGNIYANAIHDKAQVIDKIDRLIDKLKLL